MMTYVDKNMESIVVRHYTSFIDEYGQQHTEYSDRNSKMFIRPTKMENVNDPLYNRISLCGVSTDDSITDEDNIIYRDKEFKVAQKVWANGKSAYLLELWQH